MYPFIIWVLLTVGSDVNGVGIFHEGAKIELTPRGDPSDSIFFGYTVLLSDNRLYVGAPKAKDKKIQTGGFFYCTLQDLHNLNKTCQEGFKDKRQVLRTHHNYFRSDMWLGASIATVNNSDLVVCAPRRSTMYSNDLALVNGACFVWSNERLTTLLLPLDDKYRQAFITDGSRQDFGEPAAKLNYYAFGQAGLSIKVTENNKVLIGSPGLLQWAGGVTEYVNFMQLPHIPANPFFTEEIGPTGYFGYSVESGIFDDSAETLYVAGAPRDRNGYGQVLIFTSRWTETSPLEVKLKLIGKQLGSYFGATLLCVDINGDSRLDLLVGAPNYVANDVGIPYDQGAVYVFLNERIRHTSFDLNENNVVMGSSKSGARFGTAMADLGDIDGDGYIDVGIGAPWEDNESGAVYIYKGSAAGLSNTFAQRIVVEGTQSFGFSISKGIDIDHNFCTDLAVGAPLSGKAYIFGCIRSMEVTSSILVQNELDLPQNATNFTALFCINSKPVRNWPRHASINLNAKLAVDSEKNRAHILGNPEYMIKISPGQQKCDEMIITVKPTADLSKPISIHFNLEDKTVYTSDFPTHFGRLSEKSVLHSSLDIQLTRDCGSDLTCQPVLTLNVTPFVNPYIPGSGNKLGIIITVLNKEEPAYGPRVNLVLPLQPIRVPGECLLRELNMTCHVPSPLNRLKSVTWEIELEYHHKDNDRTVLKVFAELEEPYLNTKGKAKNIILTIAPETSFSLNGKAVQNVTLTRQKFYENANITFNHNFEITNLGPSDWYYLITRLNISEMVNISNKLEYCNEITSECSLDIPANTSVPISFVLLFQVKKYRHYLEKRGSINLTTALILEKHNKTVMVTTLLILEPAPPLWPMVVGSIVGLLLLAVIVFVLQRHGFFSRNRHEDLKRLQEECSSTEEIEPPKPTGSSGNTLALDVHESSQELLSQSDTD